MTQHWHAYSYTGRSYSDGLIRRGEVPSNYPPIEIKNWLTRPADHVMNTFHDVEKAMTWLEEELSQNPHVEEALFPLADRLQYSRDTLDQTAGNDVVHGYYSKAQQYISRALIACPREGFPICPYGIA
ncbi:hypothetical protein [Streptomyces sp. AC1-42W]|uniref:hypothetical protein n=1 Tax=Streptomyces sp. AC1-42W TaxID=2218666 RepID=UPI0011B937C2|nr:hypothetical protein [Streptomyces sp. AC1-42W]